MNPFEGLAIVINGLIHEHDLQGWFRLAFSFIVSWFAVSTGTCGAALLAHSSWPIAIGAGLVSGCGAIIRLVRTSDKLKGMTFVWSTAVPADMTSYTTDKK